MFACSVRQILARFNRSPLLRLSVLFAGLGPELVDMDALEDWLMWVEHSVDGTKPAVQQDEGDPQSRRVYCNPWLEVRFCDNPTLNLAVCEIDCALN